MEIFEWFVAVIPRPRFHFPASKTFMMWFVDPLLGNDEEIRKCTRDIAK
jgi:hypothetical protein